METMKISTTLLVLQTSQETRVITKNFTMPLARIKQKISFLLPNVTKRFLSIIKHKCEDKVEINTLHLSGQTYMYTKDTAKAGMLNKHFFVFFQKGKNLNRTSSY